MRRLFAVGSAGNEHLTSLVASLLLVLLAVEGVTLIDMRALLTVHVFVGMLLIPPIGLKLASTSWRMLHYYRGSEEYVRRGPPHLLLRSLVAPVVILSTVALFGTGVALLLLGRTQGILVLLHQASFAVWVGATGIHVLAHSLDLWRALRRRRLPGTLLRVGLVTGALACGAFLAVATLPSADQLQDRVSGRVGFDDH